MKTINRGAAPKKPRRRKSRFGTTTHTHPLTHHHDELTSESDTQSTRSTPRTTPRSTPRRTKSWRRRGVETIVLESPKPSPRLSQRDRPPDAPRKRSSPTPINLFDPSPGGFSPETAERRRKAQAIAARMMGGRSGVQVIRQGPTAEEKQEFEADVDRRAKEREQELPEHLIADYEGMA